jgi:hypothetical protein
MQFIRKPSVSKSSSKTFLVFSFLEIFGKNEVIGDRFQVSTIVVLSQDTADASLTMKPFLTNGSLSREMLSSVPPRTYLAMRFVIFSLSLESACDRVL